MATLSTANCATANRAALIIPALDEEPVIGRTLDQVPRGLYREIIVADNGSRDRTAEIARARTRPENADHGEHWPARSW